MDRILRLGAPALALAFIIGCGDQETTPLADVPAPSGPAAAPNAAPAPDAVPAPTPVEPAPASPDAAATPAAPDVEAAPAEEPKADEPKAEEPKTDEPALEAPKADATELSEDEIANIKTLPAEDQEAALKQAVCPVSGENLGAMDAPIKVTAEDRSFFLCCDGCKDDVDKDAKAVLAKLDELLKAK